MADDHHAERPEFAPELPSRDRETAPQSPYELHEVGIGFAVLAVGLLASYGLAYVLA
jgi:hypothetical protein